VAKYILEKSSVYAQYMRVTDRQIDRQTDKKVISVAERLLDNVH